MEKFKWDLGAYFERAGEGPWKYPLRSQEGSNLRRIEIYRNPMITRFNQSIGIPNS